MATNFRKKTSNMLVTILIGFIVVSFMFTGYESMRGTPDTVINVGGKLVKASEFKSEYDRQINFYRQITGGKNLTSQQIEQFGIKKNIISNLINRKLMLHLGDRMDLSASKDEITSRIKDLPYFKTNKQFDINRYKALLAANGLSPADFEKQIGDEILGNKAQDYFKYIPFSNPMVEDIITFKNNVKVVHLVQVKKQDLREFVPVLKNEIEDYLKKEVNKARVENLFKERRISFDKPEKVTASHILISSKTKDAEKKANDLYKKVNKANFAKLAKEHTEDPSGKNNGGSLGEFARGRMVPEFEKVAFSQKVGTISKPVKTQFGYHIIYTTAKNPAVVANFKDYRDELAKELIQKEKKDQLKKLMASVKFDIENAFKQNNIKKVSSLAKKYNLKFEESANISKYDGSTSQISISREGIKEIFASTAGTLKTFDKDDQSVIALVTNNPAKNLAELKVETEQRGLANAFGRKYQQEMIKNLEENINVKVFSNLIQ